MFKQSLHRNREVILPVLSFQIDIIEILNSVLNYVEIQSKKFKTKKFRTDTQI